MDQLFKRPNWQLSILSGILMGLSTQSIGLGFLAWIGLIPFIHVLSTVNASDGMRNGILFGITFHLISVYWIGNNSGASFAVVFTSLIAAVIYLSLFWMAMGWLLPTLRKKGANLYLILPFIIVTLEWIRSFGPLGFPWLNLAITQSHYLPMIQMIDLTGTYGVTFWLVALNSILYLLSQRRVEWKKPILFLGAFFMSLMIVGFARMDGYRNTDHSISVAVIQPNIDPNEKWDRSSREKTIATMDSLHQIAIKLKPNLILWPEAALPIYLRLNNYHKKRIQAIVDQSNIPLLTGIVDRRLENDERKYFNGTMYFSPNKKPKHYNKVHLVPFAEYIPLSTVFPELKKLNFGQGNFSHGDEYTLFEIDSTYFSNVICYESSMPNLVRQFVKKGASFLTIEANDGYLGNTSGPHQHFELAKLRAIENRIPVIRSANTGISGMITAGGHVLSKVNLGNQQVFIANVPMGPVGSFYSSFGDIFAMICVVILLSIGIKIWLRK